MAWCVGVTLDIEAKGMIYWLCRLGERSWERIMESLDTGITMEEVCVAGQAVVCDGCLTAAYDEGAGDPGLQRTVCLDMGADIADHLCDAREEPGTGPCACACNS